MGINQFFHWFKRTFSEEIHRLKKGENISEKNIVIDNFIIDMNGIFHSSTQKIYEYGEHKPQVRLLGEQRPSRNGVQQQIECFKHICTSIELVLKIINPRKKLILCVDGPAPLSKQCQQRKRRFVSAMTRTENTWDSNQITPGTKFMDYLTKYIDWYIRKQMSQDDSIWSKIEIIFSNEKAPGEGEHKLINWVRKYGNPTESYCINGMDADLIMLALGTHLPNFFILREEPRSSEFDFYVINIGGVREALIEKLKWENGHKFKPNNAINDFIFICFTVGNDFLPHIPGLEIIEGGIDFMIDIYHTVGEKVGHLTRIRNNKVQFRKKSLKIFMELISHYEKDVLQQKLIHKKDFFFFSILQSNSKYKDGKYDLDIDQYRLDYYHTNLPDIKNIELLCHDYLEGMQWVLDYYTTGVPNWKWKFPYHYSPFAFSISQYIDTYNFSAYFPTVPTLPFVQLLSVLPPRSSGLLPEPLNNILTRDLIDYCPKDFKIDLSGKRRQWEGVVLLPIVDCDRIEKIYENFIEKVDPHDRKRNIVGKSFIYKQSSNYSLFQSFYGNFESNVITTVIEL